MKSRRIAVIDVGSNTVKLLVAERAPCGRPTALHQRTMETRISAGLSGNPPRLSEAGMDAGVAAITALLREARDNIDLVARERDELGCSHAEVGAWVAEQWGLPRYLVDSIRLSESEPATDNAFQACVQLSGAVADLWLDEDADGARERALHEVHERLQLDSARFDQVLARISDALPDIASLFETGLSSPSRVRELIDHAQELTTLRNLREMQDAEQARRRADEFEARAKRLADQAHRDALTGVLNRRQLETVLDQEFQRAGRHGWPLSETHPVQSSYQVGLEREARMK